MALMAWDGTAWAPRAIWGRREGASPGYSTAIPSSSWSFGATFIVFKAVNAVKSMRVSKEAEQEGLDVPEFGFLGYPEDAIHATES